MQANGNILILLLGLFEPQFPIWKTGIRRPTQVDTMQKTGRKHAVSDNHCFCSFNASVPETQSDLFPDDKCGLERTLIQVRWESKNPDPKWGSEKPRSSIGES